MKTFNYYKHELEQLKNSEYFKSIKLFDGIGNNTNQMNLNVESIPILIKFLERELVFQKQIEKELKQKEKDCKHEEIKLTGKAETENLHCSCGFSIPF